MSLAIPELAIEHGDFADPSGLSSDDTIVFLTNLHAVTLATPCGEIVMPPGLFASRRVLGGVTVEVTVSPHEVALDRDQAAGLVERLATIVDATSLTRGPGYDLPAALLGVRVKLIARAMPRRVILSSWCDDHVRVQLRIDRFDDAGRFLVTVDASAPRMKARLYEIVAGLRAEDGVDIETPRMVDGETFHRALALLRHDLSGDS